MITSKPKSSKHNTYSCFIFRIGRTGQGYIEINPL